MRFDLMAFVLGSLDRGRAYVRSCWRDDVLAAMVVSVLLIPQSLAYALLAGLPPQVGLYASLLPLLMYALLGSSPVLNVGPVAVIAVMVAQGMAHLPAGVSPSEAALVLAAQTGLLLAVAAALRLDALASLLSVPVLYGFETGATLLIAASQLPVLLGSPAQGFELRQLLGSAQSSGWQWQAEAAVLGGLAVLGLLAARHGLAAFLARCLRPGWAQLGARLAPLLVLGLGAAWAFSRGGLQQDLALVGPLPPLSWPSSWLRLDADLWRQLWPAACGVALVSYVSSLAVAESLARRRKDRVLPRRELLGLAGANLAAAFSGGMPVAGSFSRSVLMQDAGSRSRVSGALVALFIGLVMWGLADALAWLPKTVLAATITVAVLSGLRASPFVQAWRYAPAEAALMALVAALVLFGSVQLALAFGVLGAVALLLKRTAQPHVALIGRVPGTEHYRNVDRHQVERLPDVLGLRIDESLLFTNVRSLIDVVQQHLQQHPQARRVVLQMSPVNGIDFSGLDALRELHDSLQRQGIRLDLSELKGPVLDRLRASRWERWFRGQVFLSHHQGMLADRHDSDWASP